MNTMKIHIKNFGCQMNKLDAALVTSALKQKGCTLEDSLTNADIILFNTCSVREHAEERVFANLGHIKHLQKKRPEIITIVFGCMAQRLGDKLLEHPAVNLVVGPSQIPQIPALIEDLLDKHGDAKVIVTEKVRQKLPDDTSDMLEKFEQIHDSDDKNIKCQAFVRAMRGCNKFCTYCIVPYVRGPEVSRPIDAILSQVKHLAEQGTKQITLLGQTINRYNYQNQNLAVLLEKVSQVIGIEQVKFITSHPAEFSDDIFHAIANNNKISPYLHVPAQSGSDTILKAMNRNYTVGKYLELVDRARNIVPGIAISSDFIVGFPGETDEDFQKTADLIKKVRFKNSFIFKYSPRPGTKSQEKLQDTVTEEVKKQRNAELLDIQNAISQEDNAKFLNTTVRVMVEGLSKKPHVNRAENNDLPQLVGRTSSDYIVVFNGSESLAGDFVDVKIIKTASLTLFGQL